MRRETILVAEDDRTASGVSLAELLEGQGFEVVLAKTGAQAESVLSEKEPDLALLDIRMPGPDGLTVLRNARARGADTALIVMTAHGDSNTAIEAMKSGAFDYVLKPIDFQLLLPQIKRALEHRRLSKELKGTRLKRGEQRRTPLAIIGQSPVTATYIQANRAGSAPRTRRCWSVASRGRVRNLS